MANAQLQALFSPPRNSANPKVASTYTPQFSTGEDGKLYKLASEADRNKFHILTDTEIDEELRVSQEMASTLRTINPKKPAKQQAHTVKLGTGSRGKKIEKRAWEKKIAPQVHEEEGRDHDTDNAKGPELSADDSLLHSVADMQKKYTANLSVIERLISEKMQMEEKLKSVQRELKKSKKLNHFQSAQQFKKNKDGQLVEGNATIQSVDALKKYYHQNLDLIESLYLQQKITENKLITYEHEFIEINRDQDKSNEKKDPKLKSAKITTPSADIDVIRNSATDTNNKYLRNLTIVEQLFVERKSLSAEVQSLKSQLWSFKRASALKDTTGGADESPQQQQGGTSLSREQFHSLLPDKGNLHHTAPGALQKDLLSNKMAVDDTIRADLENEEDDEEELPKFEEEDVDTGEGTEGGGGGGGGKQASLSSASGGSSNVHNVMHLKRSSSPTLQKSKSKSKSKDPYMEKIRQSEEKYFEKKRLAVEREKQEALEQEMYEFEMEKKRLRASKIKHQVVTINGKEKKVIVAEGMSGMAERDKIAEQRRAERVAKKKEVDDAAALDQQRAVEKEKKKVERLTKSIALQREKEETLKKKAQEGKGEVVPGQDTVSKKKENTKEIPPKPKLSPAEITEKLQRQQQAWDEKIAKDKEAKKAKLVQTTQDKSVGEMLRRQEEREQKLREKHQARELEAKLAADAVVAEDQARKEKLRRRAQLNGAAAKENAAKAKLEETLKAEEEEKKKTKKKSKKAESETSAPTYKNAAEMIKALTKKGQGQPKARPPADKEEDDGGKAQKESVDVDNTEQEVKIMEEEEAEEENEEEEPDTHTEDIDE